ncbi:MAG: DUF3570 domain-containing protein [Bacteroidota bacterium]
MKTIHLLTYLMCFSWTWALAQDRDSLAEPLPIDVNFLFNYYEQDGEHSAVTGGIGTQELRDREARITALIPLDSSVRIQVQAHINNYTSASTDRIDSRLSSASLKDNHATIILGYERQNLVKGYTWGVSAGYGIESDYISSSLGGHWVLSDEDQNQELAIRFMAYFDTWIVIFPEELRSDGLASVSTDKRRSFVLGATWSKIINPRLQTALLGEVVVQQGLLSTPFHRVYIPGDSLPRIETLPGWKVKVPLAARISYFPLDWLLLRGYYRFYYDSFDLLAQTASLEVPMKIGTAWSVYPFYRLHVQRAARYFAPYLQHDPQAEFYTSDYDLSAFQSHKLGVGLGINPLFGFLRFQTSPRRIMMLRGIDLRGAWYQRSDGLQAWTASLALNWRM